MKKILITGGAGYKGVLLAEELLNLGHNVTIFDNFMYGYDSVFHLISKIRLTINKKDIRNIELSDVSKFDTIYHLAGISGMPACAQNPASAEAINFEGTKKLVSLLTKDQLLINASTTSMYGFSETICDEKSLINPVSIYGKTKYEAEKYVHENHENSISLRFATVFGVSPRMRNDLMVNDFTYKAIHERSVILFAGDTKRTFIHIKDAIRGYIFAMENADTMKGQVYNIGTEAMNLSKKEIANKIKQSVDFDLIDSSLSDLDKRNFEISFQKMRDMGFECDYTMDSGIYDLVKLYRIYVQYTPYKVI